MPPMPKTRHLPFNPPRKLSTVGESSKSAPGPASSKSKKRGPVTEAGPSTSKSGGDNNPKKRRRSARASPSPPPDDAPDEEEEEEVEAADSSSASPSGAAPVQERPQSPDDYDDDYYNASPEPDYMLAEITTAVDPADEDIMTSIPKVPSKLITALLHEHFQDDKTRVTKDATKVYAKYVEIFVREAVARAVYEKQEAAGAQALGRDRVQHTLEGYLEVEDLEKLVPQLLMDF